MVVDLFYMLSFGDYISLHFRNRTIYKLEVTEFKKSEKKKEQK